MSINKENYEKLKEQFGDVASWAIWKEPDQKPTSNTSDLTIFDTPDILSKLNTGYVFVGLNAANHNQEHVDAWKSFHSTYRYQKDYKLRYALMNDDRFWGSYITDVIKGYPETNSGKVMRAVKNGLIDMNKHIEIFEKELKLLSFQNPILIAFGNDPYKLLTSHLQNEYRIIKIPHYSYAGKGMANLDKYKSSVLELLKDCKKLV